MYWRLLENFDMWFTPRRFEKTTCSHFEGVAWPGVTPELDIALELHCSSWISP